MPPLSPTCKGAGLLTPLQSLARIENGSIAVSRIHEVATLSKEPDRAQLTDAPAEWPSQGEVVFDNVKLRYKFVAFLTTSSALQSY